MARLLLPPMELWRWTLIDVLQGLFAVFAVTFFCVLWLLRRPRRRRVTPARVGRGVADRRVGRRGIEARRLGQRVLSAQSDGARALPEAAGQTREHARRRRTERMETLPETTSKNATKTYDSLGIEWECVWSAPPYAGASAPVEHRKNGDTQECKQDIRQRRPRHGVERAAAELELGTGTSRQGALGVQ